MKVSTIACVTVALLVGTSLRAGELDAEYAAGAPTKERAVRTVAAAPASATSLSQGERADIAQATELDSESPVQSWCHFGRRFGWGGWGGWGFMRPIGWGGGWGGWGGYGLGWGGYGLGWGGYGLGWGGGWGGFGCGWPYFGYGLGMGYW